MPQLDSRLQKLVTHIGKREQERRAALRAWWGGNESVPAEMPPWPDDSLGDRFFSGIQIAEAREAPCLATADIPDATVITADHAHWIVATSALVRAVVFDGLTVEDPAVSRLLGVLAPIVEAECSYLEALRDWLDRDGLEGAEDVPEFPDLSGPLFLLGGTALVDAVWAAAGEDPLSEVLSVLQSALEGAVAGLDSRIVAEALIGAFAMHYRCEQPGDAELLERIRWADTGDPIEDLVAAGAVSRGDAVRVALTVLSVLADLCRSGSPSLLRSAA